MFGYEPRKMIDERVFLLATPEKALLDLLYLYPFYDSFDELVGLRLDEDFMLDDFNYDRMYHYLDRFGSIALNRRVSKLIHIYGL